jgi:DMSO/TMAO reductase YedYZ molybdopterin-dependent catalytic subunit
MPSATRLGWVYSFAVGGLASATGLLLQDYLRSAWQIRGLPERVMEWLLLYLPLDLFERGIGQFGASAKVIGLTATTFGMAMVLALIGAAALHAGWSSWRLLGIGLALWLLTMAVVMPITGAGFFASSLQVEPALSAAGYLFVALGYVSVLTGGRLVAQRSVRTRSIVLAERRALLTSLVGAVAAGGLAQILGRGGGFVISSLPLALPPSQTASTQPQLVTTPAAPSSARTLTAISTAGASSAGTATAGQRALAAPVGGSAATLEPVLEPPPPRPLNRDQDGSLTAAGRPKGQLAPAITANDDFYVVTKNAVADPQLDAAAWRLVIEGEVQNPVQVDYRTLRTLPSVEVVRTLECISNLTSGCNLTTFGCDLISTARWRGARLADVLELAGGLKATAVGLAFMSADEFSAGLPVDVAADPNALVVFEMNGLPLPREHGFPVRLLVAGRYGMKNPKWLTSIRVMDREYLGWYEQRNWNKDGFVKTMSRIDVPEDGASLVAGDQRLAGIAYAGSRGVSKVDYSTDGGATWRPARLLGAMPGSDAMVRWDATFPIGAGQTLDITVRATDGQGDEQTEEFQLPQPDGATGRPSITATGA